MSNAKRFSQLSQDDQQEILNSDGFARYAEQIKREDWLFSKIEKGKYAGTWATY